MSRVMHHLDDLGTVQPELKVMVHVELCMKGVGETTHIGRQCNIYDLKTKVYEGLVIFFFFFFGRGGGRRGKK